VSDDLEARVEAGGGSARARRLRRMGRQTARERIEALADQGSFQELRRYQGHGHAHVHPDLAQTDPPGDGLITGLCTVDGREVAVAAHDVTVHRGSIGSGGGARMTHLLQIAGARGLPVITLADSDGARIPEGVDAVVAAGSVMAECAKLRGVVPQITLVCGLCVGAAAYSAALGDLTAMVEGQGFMFITGPSVTKVATGQDVTIEDLGGPDLHATKTGSCAYIARNESDGIGWVREVLGFLTPQVASDDPPDRATPELADIIPTQHRMGYDARKVVRSLFDRESVLELHPTFAPNLITGFARLGGQAVAWLASQPMHWAGCLDVDASRKGASFIRRASAWGIPIITLVDVPGYLPGKEQEAGGILPIGAEVIAAYAEARVPRICLVLRKSYGGGNVLTYSADVRLALPTARVAPVGVEAALEVALGPPPENATPDQVAAREAHRAAWLAQHDTVEAAGRAGYLDQVIEPAQARVALARTLRRLA
jgi:acetyl-CoA carboxylase carboxyltransferase component